MASIRRTLSPIPRPGSLMNGEACQVSSPLYKSSMNNQNYPSHGGLLPSSLSPLVYALYKARNFVFGLFSQKYSRPIDRPKQKGGQIWRRAFSHFLMCFFVGVFLGLTPFFPTNMSENIMSKQKIVDIELPLPVLINESYTGLKIDVSAKISSNENSTWEQEKADVELEDGHNSSGRASNLIFDKLLIIVTPTHARTRQGYYMSRLAHTLRLVRHPLLWIVVEMNTQSVEIAELLRNTGVMYRHLVCVSNNSTGVMDKSVRLWNVALSHIETHRLDGIVYFADEDKIYATELFEEMRKISRMGTWTVAKLDESRGEILLVGPVCNSSQVTGWHVVDGREKRFRRFHAEMSGFAFNSTIIWDPKSWHRPTIEPLRQLETVKEDMQASTFIEQVVEDESQMECFSMNTSGIMVWYHAIGSRSYRHNWFSSIV